MKNQYFGDESDYRKYGLLRCVADVTGLPIGIIWMLTEDDGGNDGELRAYLRDAAKWRGHDPSLFDALKKLLDDDIARDVELAKAWEIIPKATYFSGLFTDSSPGRKAAFESAVTTVDGCPFVFLDPDNGLEVNNHRYGNRGSSRYVYWGELGALFENGKSLIVYQHYPRKKRGPFERAMAEEFRRRLGAAEVAVYSTPRVAFVLALQEEHRGHLPSIRKIIAERWGDGEQIFSRERSEDLVKDVSQAKPATRPNP
jgi:hypothetical protein